MAAIVRALDPPGEAGVLRESRRFLLCDGGNVHIHPLLLPVVHSGEEHQALPLIGDGILHIAVHIVFRNLEILFQLLLPCRMHAPGRVGRDAQGQEQSRRQGQADDPFLFQGYDPFRGFLYGPGIKGRRVADVSLFQEIERLGDDFPLHTSNPSFIR